MVVSGGFLLCDLSNVWREAPTLSLFYLLTKLEYDLMMAMSIRRCR